MSDVTKILHQIESGDPSAAAELFPLVYGELRKLAAAQMAGERAGQSLNATALVHEAWLRLAGDGVQPHWEGRRHFFGAAANAMRRVLVDRARQRKRLKRGGEFLRQHVDLDQLAGESADDELLALHEALDALAKHDATKARLVELRYFAGLTLPEAAEALAISPSTADRAWRYARAWLYSEMEQQSKKSDDLVT